MTEEIPDLGGLRAFSTIRREAVREVEECSPPPKKRPPTEDKENEEEKKGKREDCTPEAIKRKQCTCYCCCFDKYDVSRLPPDDRERF